MTPEQILNELRRRSRLAKLSQSFAAPATPRSIEDELAEARKTIDWMRTAIQSGNCHGSVVQLALKTLMLRTGVQEIEINVSDLPEEHQDLGVQTITLELKEYPDEDGGTSYAVNVK